jgi:5-methylcytosine-specific restriction protein A
MSRREFPKQVKRQAFDRAEGKCELCGVRLTFGKYAYDHIIPDGLGGEPTLENCQVACNPCHSEKTGKQDIPRIAKVKRIRDREKGIKKRSYFPGSKDSGWKKKMDGTVERRR